MIRDSFRNITRDLCVKWELKQHLNGVSHETLEVNSAGELSEREEPSCNSYHKGTYTLIHTFGVSCNCDWCAEWDNNANNVQGDFETKSDFILACIENNDNGSQIEDYITEKIEEIPIGFFDDESNF